MQCATTQRHTHTHTHPTAMRDFVHNARHDKANNNDNDNYDRNHQTTGAAAIWVWRAAG